MPKYRTHKNADLPPRMHLKHGRYYLTVRGGGKTRWIGLSRNFSKALAQYHELQAGQDNVGRRFIDLYMRYRRHEFYEDLADSTKIRYEYAFQNFLPVFRDVDVADIRPSDIYTYLQLRKQHKDAANTEHGILKKMFDLARLMGWRDDNPAANIPWFSTPRRERVLTPAEFSAIHLAANAPVQVAMDLAYMLGLRIGDILALTWGQVDDGGVLVKHAKNKVSGYYVMTDELKGVLQRARSLRGHEALPTSRLPIVHTRRLTPYTYYGFRSMFRQAVERSGVVNVRFHDIRRTAITAAVDEGRTPQSFSLHKSARQAQDYVVRVPNVMPLKAL